jgi:prepilin-type N-terminal cleavage/methylation domain-containing protein
MKRPTTSSRRGFTLVEILVVITIVIVLAAVVFAVAGRMKKSASTAVTTSNMRQLGVALISFTADNGRFPGHNTDPAWDRAIIPHLSYTDPLPGGDRSPIKASETPGLASVAQMFVSPSDKKGKLSDSYRRSFAIIPWTTNLKVGNTIRGWKDLPAGAGVRYAMLDYPEKSAMVVQWFSDGKTVTNQLGIGGHSYHDHGGPTEELDSSKQLVLFADGHIDAVPAKLTGKEFRDKYWPGKIENLN